MHVLFPFQLMRQSARFRIVGQSSGVVSGISGAMTVRASLGAHWEATVSLVAKTEAQHLALRAFLAGMEGSLGTTDVPEISAFRPRDRDGHGVVMCSVGTLSDAQTFDHFGFANDQIVGARLAGSAAVRATTITVTYADSVGLRPGHRFSIAGNLYEVQAAWVNDNGRPVVQFQPPLRAAAAEGDVVELFHPVCRMRLAETPDYQDAGTRMQVVSLSLVEAI